MVRSRPGGPANPSRPGEPHVVQLYTEEEQLVESVSSYVAEVLATHDGSFLLVATRDHWSRFWNRLSARGIQVRRALQEGQLSYVSVEEALPQFLEEGRPHAGRFQALATRLLERARGDGRFTHVHVFGELVDALWRQRAESAAVELEALWNALRKKEEFSLLCGYALRGHLFERARLVAAVQNNHTHATLAEAPPTRRPQVVIEMGHPSHDSTTRLVHALQAYGFA